MPTPVNKPIHELLRNISQSSSKLPFILTREIIVTDCIDYPKSTKGRPAIRVRIKPLPVTADRSVQGFTVSASQPLLTRRQYWCTVPLRTRLSLLFAITPSIPLYAITFQQVTF